MRALLVVSLLVFVVLVLWFLLSPLVRDEEDIVDFDRPRPGTRKLHGPDPDETPQTRAPPPEEEGVTRCSHCGAIIEKEYTYCAECLGKVR